MAAKKTIQVKAEDDGWTQWIQISETQTFVCCDCSLYHQFQFQPRNLQPNGFIELWMRAKFDNRRTANARRRK